MKDRIILPQFKGMYSPGHPGHLLEDVEFVRPNGEKFTVPAGTKVIVMQLTLGYSAKTKKVVTDKIIAQIHLIGSTDHFFCPREKVALEYYELDGEFIPEISAMELYERIKKKYR